MNGFNGLSFNSFCFFFDLDLRRTARSSASAISGTGSPPPAAVASPSTISSSSGVASGGRSSASASSSCSPSSSVEPVSGCTGASAAWSLMDKMYADCRRIFASFLVGASAGSSSAAVSSSSSPSTRLSFSSRTILSMPSSWPWAWSCALPSMTFQSHNCSAWWYRNSMYPRVVTRNSFGPFGELQVLLNSSRCDILLSFIDLDLSSSVRASDIGLPCAVSAVDAPLVLSKTSDSPSLGPGTLDCWSCLALGPASGGRGSSGGLGLMPPSLALLAAAASSSATLAGVLVSSPAPSAESSGGRARGLAGTNSAPPPPPSPSST
mmetsp:Transcript_98007/g.299598  ORF Transcript_98007/g.299598 Transcript_98007/m.299598 type:complete len:322 (+) Transcript_98007:1697-2662(+)